MLLKKSILICQCLKKVLAGDINLCVLKKKKDKLNIQLGQEGGKVLNIFNDNIIDYKVIGE